MKINPGWRPAGQSLHVPDATATPSIQQKPFADLLRRQDGEADQGELQKIVEQLQLQGERLAKSMTVRELRQYKLLLKRFLEETVRKGVTMKDTRGWDRRGRTKRYKLLEEIDKTLTSMADELLETEQGRIDILVKIGDIKG
ncbi:MAG: YaaR family protein, partial [Gorillibacterium sp.]|nr:YaaR family protein [Gorillibacterium sp.]